MSTNKLESDLVTIGYAQIVDTVSIVTIRCSCVEKKIIMGQMGVPLVCSFCKKTWFVTATAKIKIQEVIVYLNKEKGLVLKSS
jgi:hypothetical protein